MRQSSSIGALVQEQEPPTLEDLGDGWLAYVITDRFPRTDPRCLGRCGVVVLRSSSGLLRAIVERQVIDANRDAILGNRGDIVRLRTREVQLLSDDGPLVFTAEDNREVCQRDAAQT